jgi:hypothetical protein
MPGAPKAKEVKRLCPECEQEVTLIIDPETQDREGRCANCGLDVGAIVNRLRYAKAAKKVEEEEEKAKKGGKKQSEWF